jgi:hypothetical protein
MNDCITLIYVVAAFILFIVLFRAMFFKPTVTLHRYRVALNDGGSSKFFIAERVVSDGAMVYLRTGKATIVAYPVKDVLAIWRVNDKDEPA